MSCTCDSYQANSPMRNSAWYDSSLLGSLLHLPTLTSAYLAALLRCLSTAHRRFAAGLANFANTFDVATSNGAVQLIAGRPKNGNKPKKASNVSTTKLGSRRVIKAAGKAAPGYLKNAAKAKAAACAKSLKVKKSA